MKLTEKQLKIQERADNTLSFGCIIEVYTYEPSKYRDIIVEMLSTGDGQVYRTLQSDHTYEDYEFSYKPIGHPMNRGRLFYLHKTKTSNREQSRAFLILCHAFENINLQYLQQTVLERPEELQDKVIAFLETLPKE